MKGKIRVPLRNSRCPKCGSDFEDIKIKGYVCPKCLTKPIRFYLDIHFEGKRISVCSDKQGKPLDSFERAYDLLAHVNYEIENHSFDPSRYKKSEQKEFYISTNLDKYLAHKLPDIAPSYQTDFKRYIRIAKEYFTVRDVRDIRKSGIIDYQKYLRENFKLSNKTIKNIMDFFKAFLNYLKNDLEIITVVPKFPDIEIEVKPIKWFSQEDQIPIFEVVPELFKDIIAFLVLHGCRPSEARALKCKNVNLKNNAITISATFSGTVYREKRKGKKSKPVTIPIHPESYDYISYRVKNNLPDAFLFVNQLGRHYGKNALQRMFARVRKKAGIDVKVRLYDFTRHSFVSNHLNSGTGIWKTSKLVGHSSSKVTDEKYGHVDLESLRVDVPKISLNRSRTVVKDFASVKK